MSENPHHKRQSCQVWAELGMVMVPGSAEDERMFSTLKYIREPQRDSL
jgi:hypothetical protein